ncbi:MAG TPA: shikimate dehydrogenase [Galbitalea sp.]|jgi:shikimate dehydrogenase|nr:shikimate dehydrogenase [Galbitalea sp.]
MAVARLAVLGSPIAHSLSPELHSAAYRALGLDWSYEAVEVTRDRLADFVTSRDDSWRGLSLTMPLKVEILPLLGEVSELARETGSANTVLFDRAGPRGFNTDVFGLVEGFSRHGRTALGSVLVLGGGATAASAIVASARLGAHTVFVGVRSPERASALHSVASAQGVELQVRQLEDLLQIDERLDAVISTLPNGAAAEVAVDPDTVADATLFDVAYSPWPTPLAAAWTGESVIGGLEMLVLQALAQVRIFVHGDPDLKLDRDEEVLAAMRSAVDL